MKFLAENIMLSTTVGMNINPLKRSVNTAQAQLKSMNTALKAQSRAFKDAGMDASQLAEREKMLGRAIKNQEEVIEGKKVALQRATSAVKDHNNASQKEIQAVERARGALAKQEYALKGLQNEMTRTKNAQKMMTGEIAGLKAEYQQLDAATSRAVGMFKKMDNASGALRAEYKGLSAQVNKHGQVLDKEQANLKQTEYALGKSSDEYRQQSQVVAEATKKQKALEAQQTRVKTAIDKGRTSVGRNAEQMQQLGNKYKSIGSSMQGVGRSMTAAITLPVSLAIGGAIKATVGWEDALSNVAKTTNANEGQMKKYGDSIRNMARSMPESQETLANTMSVAAQLGISGGKNLEKFTKVATQMGVATDMSAEEASNAMAKFANATGKPDSDFNKLGSTVVQLGNNMAAQEGNIMDFAQRLAGSATVAGMGQKDIMAMSAAMASVGINAEAGGSAMSKILTKINDAVMDGGKDLKGFAKVSGLSADEFSKTWGKDPYKAVQLFEQGLNKQSKAGENVNSTLADLGIKEIRERDTVLRLANGNKQLADARTNADKGFKEGIALNQEAETKYKTLGNQMKIFMNNVRDLGISIGGALAPLIKFIMQGLTPLIQWLSQAPGPVRAFVGVLALIAAALGPVIVGLGMLVASIGAIAGSTVAMAILGAIGSALAALVGPIGLAIAGIAALIAALAWLNTKIKPIDWGPIWNGLKTGVINVWNSTVAWFKNAWASFTAWLPSNKGQLSASWSSVWSGIVTVVRNVFGSVVGAVKTGFWAVINFFKYIGGFLKPVFTLIWSGLTVVARWYMTNIFSVVKSIFFRIVNWFRYIGGILKSVFITMWGGIKAVTLPIVRSIGNVIRSVWTGISNVTRTIFGGILAFLRPIWNGIKAVVSWGAQATKVVALIAFVSLRNTTVFIFNAIKTFLTFIWKKIKTSVMFYVNFIRRGMTVAWQILSKVTRTIFNAVRSFLVAIWVNIKNRVVAQARFLWSIVRGIWNVLSKVTRSIFNSVRNFVVAVWTNLRNRVVAFTRSLWNIIRPIWQTLSKVTRSIFNSVRNFVVAVWTNLRNRVVAFTRSLWNIVRGIWNILSKVTRNIFNSVRNFLIAVWTKIRNSVAGLARSLWSKVSGTWNSLSSGTKKIFNAVRNYLVDKWQGIKNSVTGIVSDLWGSVKKTFTNMNNGIKGLAGKIGDTISGMVKGIKKGLNALIKGVNWVAKKLGIDEKIPELSTGTGGVNYAPTGVGAGVSNGVVSSGGFATVNDRGRGNGSGANGHQELIQKANGQVFAPKGRDVTVPLSKGDRVINGRDTQRLQKSGAIPKFSKGIGSGIVSERMLKDAKKKKKKKHDEEHGAMDVIGSRFGVAGGGKSWQEKIASGLGAAAGKLEGGKDKVVAGAKAGAKVVGEKIGEVLDYVGKPGKLLDAVLGKFGVKFPKVKGQITKDMMWDPMWKQLKNGTRTLFDGWLTEADGAGDGGYVDLSKGINFGFARTAAEAARMGYPFPRPHHGLDINYKYGEKLYSTLGGKGTGKSGYNGGFGNSMWLKSGNLEAIYGHMSKLAWNGTKSVKPGTYLGKVGSTGDSTGPHLHYEMRKNGVPFDPTKWLKSNNGGGAGGKWKGTVKKALKIAGLPTGSKYVNAWLKQIQTESGGNAKALGGTDGLADGRAKGLVQVKPGTFNAYKMKGYGNIWKGLDNLIAGMRYANSRYGNAGLGVVGKGHGYAKGTNAARAGLANVFEKGGEIMNLRGGEQIIPNDVSITALKQMMSSDIFARTQSAVYAGISQYADALRQQQAQTRAKELQARQQANASSSEIAELKSMVADMVYLMQAQLGVQENIAGTNQQIANKDLNLDGKKVTKDVSEQEAFNLLMRNYNSGITR
ncbi:minor tail protein [Staphylococcus phage SpP]